VRNDDIHMIDKPIFLAEYARKYAVSEAYAKALFARGAICGRLIEDHLLLEDKQPPEREGDANDKSARISAVDAILIVAGGVAGCIAGSKLAWIHIRNDEMLKIVVHREEMVGPTVLGYVLIGWITGCILVHRCLRLWRARRDQGRRDEST